MKWNASSLPHSKNCFDNVLQIMKKMFIISAMFVSMLAVSCGGGAKSGSAKDVAGKFTKAFFVDMNLEAARRFVAPELLDEFPEAGDMGELEKHFIKILADHAEAYGYRFEYDAGKSVATDSIADIFYVLTANGNPDWKGTGEVDLAKDADGRWTVNDYAFDRDENAIDFGF